MKKGVIPHKAIELSPGITFSKVFVIMNPVFSRDMSRNKWKYLLKDSMKSCGMPVTNTFSWKVLTLEQRTIFRHVAIDILQFIYFFHRNEYLSFMTMRLKYVLIQHIQRMVKILL